MPSASKNIYCSQSSSWPYVISVTFSESNPSVTNNTSKISISGYLVGNSVYWEAGYPARLKLYWHDNRTGKDTLVATSSDFYSTAKGVKKTVSGSITVTHKDDGSLIGYAKLSYEAPSGLSGGWAPASNTVQTANTTLTTIARASSITSVTGTELGKTVTVSIDRKSDSFTHKVEYWFASGGWTTASSNAGTSCTFTPPVSMASNLPNSAAGTLTVRISTFNGSTQIGSTTSKSIFLSIPSTVVPTMGDPTIERIDNGVPSSWGIYVKGFSKAKITINSAAGVYGSTIKSYSITGGGLNSSSSSATTGVINSSGTVTFTCKITDSRNRSAEKKVSINVADYSPPSLVVKADRCLADGTVSATAGTSIRVVADYGFSSVSNKNSISSKSATCNGISETSFDDNVAFILAANASIGNTYTLTVTVTDALGKSATISVPISSASRIMNVRANKKGVAFGKFSEKDAFEVAVESDFYKRVKHGGGTYVHTSSFKRPDSGYAKIARITINGPYVDSPINIRMAARGKNSECLLTLRFQNLGGTDPDVDSFIYSSYDSYGVYIAKSSASIWELYVSRTPYDSICVLGLEYNYEEYDEGILTISWIDEQVPNLPSEYLQAANYMFLASYPVNSIYISYSHTSPASLFGGTWVRIENTFLWACDSNETIGQTGGEKSHVLTANEMPAHKHVLANANSAGDSQPNGTVTYVGKTGYVGSITTSTVGGGSAHNNMPPYIQVSVWRRIA